MTDSFGCNGDTLGGGGNNTTSGGGADFFSMYISQSDYFPTIQHSYPSEINFTPSPTKKGGNHSNAMNNGHHGNLMEANLEGGEFCHEENLADCVNFLNQELTSLGLPSLYDGASDSHDPCRLVNCTYDLLQRYQRSARLREELENRIHRQESDMTHLRDTQTRLLRQLDQSQQEAVQGQERERQLTNKNKTLSTKLKTEREEVKRLLSVIQHRDAQYKHEIKKKEREQGKLKDRVHAMLSDRKGGKFGIEISAVLMRQDGKRGKWISGTKEEEDMYRQVISHYEEKQKELLLENTGLRQCLNDIQKEVITAFREPATNGDGGLLETSQELKFRDEPDGSDDEGSQLSPEGLHDAHFQMPYEYLEGNLVKVVKEKCHQLKKHIKFIEKQQLAASAKSAERRGSPSKAEDKQKQSDLEKMQRDIQRYKDIIEEQDLFIQETLGQGELDENGFYIDDDEVLHEKNRLHFEKKLFEESKENFDKERKTYTDATIRLHKDKQKFEEDKVNYLQNQFLQMTPFQAKQMRPPQSTQRMRSKRLLPTTPAPLRHRDLSQHAVRTPDCAPRPPVTTPTTRDLYRTLGLTADHSDLDADPSRPQSADLLSSARRPRLGHFPSPAWANSARKRPSSAVTMTSPAGQYTRQPGAMETSINMHRDNIKMMLFTQHSNGSNNDGTEDR